MKLHECPSTSRNSVEQGFWLREQWRRVDLTHHRHWRRVSPSAAARNSNHQGGLVATSPLFLSSPAVKVTATCNKRKNSQTAVRFYFLSVTDLLLFNLLLCRSILFLLQIGFSSGQPLLWVSDRAALQRGRGCGRRCCRPSGG